MKPIVNVCTNQPTFAGTLLPLPASVSPVIIKKRKFVTTGLSFAVTLYIVNTCMQHVSYPQYKFPLTASFLSASSCSCFFLLSSSSFLLSSSSRSRRASSSARLHTYIHSHTQVNNLSVVLQNEGLTHFLLSSSSCFLLLSSSSFLFLSLSISSWSLRSLAASSSRRRRSRSYTSHTRQ